MVAIVDAELVCPPPHLSVIFGGGGGGMMCSFSSEEIKHLALLNLATS